MNSSMYDLWWPVIGGLLGFFILVLATKKEKGWPVTVVFPMPPSIPLTVLIVAIILLSSDGLSAYVARHIDKFASAGLAQMHQEERKLRLENDRAAIRNCGELAKVAPNHRHKRLAQCLREFS